MTTKKIIIVILTILILLVGFVYLFAQFTYRNKSCKFMNIDNIEFRTGIDIPKVTYMDCNYNETENTKEVILDVDTNSINLMGYIQRSGFKKLNSEKELSLDEFLTFKKNSDDFTDLSNFYYRQNNYKGNNSKMLLNKESARLWIFLKYPD